MEGKEMDYENQEFLDSLNKPPSFDEFIKQIKACDNLLDAFRIRDTINTEIMKKKTEISGCGGDDIINGVRVADTRLYIDRLLSAQKRIDKRIKALGGNSLVSLFINVGKG